MRVLGSIKNRLRIGFLAIFVATVSLGVYSTQQVELLGGLTEKMYRHPLTVTRASLQANVGILKMHRSMKDVALAKNDDAMAKAAAQVGEHAASLLNDIVPGVERTAELVREITAASQEQSASVGQVNTAVDQLDKASQHTAASAGQLAATAQQMNAHASQLQATIGFFRLSSEENDTVPAMEPPDSQGSTYSKSTAAQRSSELDFEPFEGAA